MIFLNESLLFEISISENDLKIPVLKDFLIQKHLSSIENDFIDKLQILFENFSKVSRPQIEFLQSLGLIINHPNTYYYSSKKVHYSHYNKYFSFENEDLFNVYLENSAPKYHKLLKNYDEIFKGRNYKLSSIGDQIVISYLHSEGHEELSKDKFIY